MRLLAVVKRVLLVFAALIAASLAAGLVMSLVLTWPEADFALQITGQKGSFWPAMVLFSLFILALSLIPAFIFIAIADGIRLRSPAGLAAGIVSWAPAGRWRDLRARQAPT